MLPHSCTTSSSNVQSVSQTRTAGVAAPLGFLPAVLHLPWSCGEFALACRCCLKIEQATALGMLLLVQL